MKFHAKNSLWFAYLLNFCCPGLGHAYYKEYLFGLFVYLIMLMATALFFLSFFVALPALVTWALFGLPTVFFAFSFLDLHRTIKARWTGTTRSSNRGLTFILLGLTYLLLAPISLGNFLLRNAPQLYTTDNSAAPAVPAGHLAMTNRLAYSADIFFVDHPVLHALPDRFDTIRFRVGDRLRTGVVIGLPGESIEVVSGTVYIDGVPLMATNPTIAALTVDWPLTSGDGQSMLVATLRPGGIEKLYQVNLYTDLLGKTLIVL
jgi:hypothetical protein